MAFLCRSNRLMSCLASCFWLNLGLSIASEHRFRYVSFEASKEGALPRREAGEIQPLMAGPYIETYLTIPGLTANSVTIKTLTQPPLTTTTTLPVYFCSETNCTATVDGAPTQFNAEIQWPATITASTGVMSPPPWATQTLSVGCDGSIYFYGAPGPTGCPSTGTAPLSPNSVNSSAGINSTSVTSTNGGSATPVSAGASGSDAATVLSGTSGSGSTVSPTIGETLGTGAWTASIVSLSGDVSASGTGARTISTATGGSIIPSSAVQINATGLLATSSGSTNSVLGSNSASLPAGGNLSSNFISKSSTNVPPPTGSPTSTASTGISSVVSPPPGNLSRSGSGIQPSVNSTVASDSPTSASRSGLSISLYPVSTANTVDASKASGSTSAASAASAPSQLTISTVGGGGQDPTTSTSAPSSITTTFVFGSSVEPAVSSATAAVNDATDQVNRLQNDQNDQNIKQNVLNLIKQANTIAHTGGIGWLFGLLGTAASEAEAVVKGTAPVADLINAWENVENAELEYSRSSSESSESSSRSEKSQRSGPTQSATTTSAYPSSLTTRTASSTAISTSSMSSSSSASSSASSCASGCTLSQVTLAEMAIDPSMSGNLAAISSVELMASSWDSPSAWGVMGDASGTGASSSMASFTGSATNPTISASASIASSTNGGITRTSPSGSAQVTVAPSDFLADGAPWFNPTSWCDYGVSNVKYPILTPSSGTLNCDYSTLPASTINLVSTTAAPTNIPGMNGVPGCNMELAGDQHICPGVDVCNCGGTYVPVLVTTAGGSVTGNCNYTIQPTASNCPTSTTNIPPSSVLTTTTTSAPPPAPTVGIIVCNPISETSGCKTSDVHANSVNATADYMGEQLSTSIFTSSTGNFTRTYRDGGASGRGVTYMMSIGWIPGCKTYASQRPDRPIDPTVEFDWKGLLEDNYYYCTDNKGLGGYVDVGCLRYGFFPNKVNGVFGAVGPANPSLFWKTMHYC